MFYIGFPPLGNSDHAVVSISIKFPLKSQQDSLFHHIAYDYSHADWYGLSDHLRVRMFHCRKSLNSVLLLLLVNFVSGFSLDLMHIFFNWNSLHAQLNSHYKAWNYKKKKHKKSKAYRKFLYKEPTVTRCLLILEVKPFRLQVKGKHSIGTEFQSLVVRGEKLLT